MLFHPSSYLPRISAGVYPGHGPLLLRRRVQAGRLEDLPRSHSTGVSQAVKQSSRAGRASSCCLLYCSLDGQPVASRARVCPRSQPWFIVRFRRISLPPSPPLLLPHPLPTFPSLSPTIPPFSPSSSSDTPRCCCALRPEPSNAPRGVHVTVAHADYDPSPFHPSSFSPYHSPAPSPSQIHRGFVLAGPCRCCALGPGAASTSRGFYGALARPGVHPGTHSHA